MVADKTFYDRLDISPDASETEINKAYKKKALQYHPDKNLNNKEEAENKFKNLTEAYEILSDTNKRKTYDKYGIEGIKDSDHDPDFFGKMYNDIFSNMFNFDTSPAQKSMPNITVDVEININEAYTGKNVKISFDKYTMQGVNIEEIRCKKCNGSGTIKLVKKLGPMTQVTSGVCRQCNQTGFNVSMLKTENVEMECNIPKGVYDGVTITIKNKGHEKDSSANECSDVVVRIKETKMTQTINGIEYTRGVGGKPHNILMELPLELHECIVGTSKKIKAINGKNIHITIPEQTFDNMLFIKNQGMPVYNKTDQFGDLYIKTSINAQTLDEKTKDALWKELSGNTRPKFTGKSLKCIKVENMMNKSEDSSSASDDENDENDENGENPFKFGGFSGMPPGMRFPGMPSGMGIPGMGIPGMGIPGMGIPGMGIPGMQNGAPPQCAQQ